jgi:hypothetical protein
VAASPKTPRARASSIGADVERAAHDVLEIDGVSERELPAFARDDRRGDRAIVLDAGLLHVRSGAAAFVKWSELLGAREHDGSVYVLVARRPPHTPWLEIAPSMLAGESAQTFAARLEERSASRVRAHRQNLEKSALHERVLARRAVPGALEVPAAQPLGRARAATFFTLAGAGFVVMEALSIAGQFGANPSEVATYTLAGWGIFAVLVTLGCWLALFAGRRRSKGADSVLVLAPDGCVAGFAGGARTLAWSEVGAFESDANAVVVKDPEGRRIGELDARRLGAPPALVAGLAETYRRSADG